MKNPTGTKQELIKEISALKRRIQELEQPDSERKKIEEAQKLHVAVTETVAEGIFLIGLEDNIIKWTNRKFEKLFGYGPGEMVGLHVDKVNAPTEQTPKETRISIVDVLRQTGEWHGEIQNIKKDGTHFWSFIHVSLFNHPEFGSVMVSAHTDITERKRADEESRINLQLLQMVIDHSQYLIYAKDLDGRFILASLSLAIFFGQRSPELLIGKTSHDFLPKEIADQHRKNDLEVIAQQSLVSFEETANTKDGINTFLTNNFPIFDDNGKIYAVCGTSVDITERKQIEDELHKLSSYNRSLIEVSLDPLVTIDRSGRIADVNISTEQVTGYSRQELIGTDFSDFFTDTEKAREGYQTVFKEGAVRDYPLEIRHRDGHITAVLYNASIYRDRTNKIMGVFASARDITARKQAEAEKAALEAQNRQLQKAESLGRMAGAIAHTFNNQLGVVIGNLELALMDLSQGAKPVNSLTTAMLAANKEAAVSGQMLTYLGQSFDKRELLNLADACRKSLTMLQAIMPDNVVLETDLPSPGPSIIANAIEIQQVLTNLITNAWEAVGAGRGYIHLRVKTVSPAEIPTVHRNPIDWQPQDNAYACLEVTDTGCGIADKDIEKIFDPFFSSKFTGRGLGLPMVLGIVKAHSGSVTVESEPGRGSTFRVFLRVSAAEVPRQPDPVVHPLTTERGGTILLVEDEEMVRHMATAMLTRLGFSVIEAKDGIEAVEVFRKRRDEIRCVLSDLTMPRMNGWETLTTLRKLAPGIPVILASGYDKAHVMSGDHPELPQAFLGKPYRLKELSDAISQALINRK